jgi:hypothetical protein
MLSIVSSGPNLRNSLASFNFPPLLYSPNQNWRGSLNVLRYCTSIALQLKTSVHSVLGRLLLIKLLDRKPEMPNLKPSPSSQFRIVHFLIVSLWISTLLVNLSILDLIPSQTLAFAFVRREMKGLCSSQEQQQGA